MDKAHEEVRGLGPWGWFMDQGSMFFCSSLIYHVFLLQPCVWRCLWEVQCAVWKGYECFEEKQRF